MKNKPKKIKRLGCILGGWHYPIQPFEALASQEIPKGWEVDLFCVSHRDPTYAHNEKQHDIHDDSLRGNLDKILYREIASVEVIKKLGWNYKEYPNTIGDWGFTNQWLDEHNYEDYDLLLLTHDDNLIISNKLFVDTITDPHFEEWDICANSTGMPPGSIRGSFEFFKPKVLKMLGGKFDLSMVSLTREGKTDSPTDKNDLYDWNNTVYPLTKFINENNLRVAYMSPCYRVSAFCIEGERGYISKTHGQNTQFEDQGLEYLKNNNLI